MVYYFWVSYSSQPWITLKHLRDSCFFTGVAVHCNCSLTIGSAGRLSRDSWVDAFTSGNSWRHFPWEWYTQLAVAGNICQLKKCLVTRRHDGVLWLLFFYFFLCLLPGVTQWLRYCVTLDVHPAYQGLIDNTQYISSFFFLISIFVELATYIQAELFFWLGVVCFFCFVVWFWFVFVLVCVLFFSLVCFWCIWVYFSFLFFSVIANDCVNVKHFSNFAWFIHLKKVLFYYMVLIIVLLIIYIY